VIFDTLNHGHAVALHCWAGLGRAGTVAARILMEREGMSADEAIAYVRQARPGSIETAAQVDYLQSLRTE
jgi:ADP-ribosyl-[dinitrogen reductase] hydrolase